MKRTLIAAIPLLVIGLGAPQVFAEPIAARQKGNEQATKAQTKGYSGKDYFVADSFSFGVEREMKESGEKGGTEDINIGVGELQEATVSDGSNGAIRPRD